MKKKSLVLAICMAVSTPVISVAQDVPDGFAGLNLGDITSSSYLGQPFRGVIPILFSTPKEVSQLKVGLAPNSIFTKIGVEKLPFLDSLSFKVGSQNNKPVIFIRSSQATDMPFISFALEIVSDLGTIYQDYTVLVDPIGYQEDKLKSSTPVQANIKNKITQKLTSNKGLEYKVTTGDTISKIAEALKTSQISLKKMIDVIHHENPKAFVNNDINKLKNSVYLKIPSANKIKNFEFSLVNKAPIKNQENTNSPLNERYTVKPGDTLSAITQQFSHEDISFTKRMHSIYNANPDAFSNNRINVLKVGATLAIPYLIKEIKQELLVNEAEEIQIESDVASSNSDIEQAISLSEDTSIAETTIAEEGTSNSNTEISDAVESSEQVSTDEIPSILSEDTSAAETTIDKEETSNSNTQIIDAVKSSEQASTDEIPSILSEDTSAAETTIDKQETSNSNTEITDAVKSSEQASTDETLSIDFEQLEEESSSTEDELVNENIVENETNDSETVINTKESTTNIIGNLEGRVRELRNSLSESKSKLSYIEDILLTKNIEVRKKNREIKSLKKYVKEELGLEEFEAIQKNGLENKIEKTVKEPLPSALKSIPPKTLPHIETKSPSTSLPKAENENNEALFLLKSLNFSDISYGFLALLLSLGLITYRKELHSYTIAAGSYPTFYPPEEGSAHRNNRKLTDVKADCSTNTLITTNDTIVNDIMLDECDKLIDELSNELRENKADASEENNKEWASLEKICDNYIEKHKEDRNNNSQYNTNVDPQAEKVLTKNAEPEISFEDMITDLIDNIDDKSIFDETNPLHGFDEKLKA